MAFSISTISRMLETYSERDKILRLLYYTSKLVSELTKSNKITTFSNSIGECRTTMRLFDDIPMLLHTLSYGLGKKEPDKKMQICGVLINVLDQLYYPFEHIAWASDNGLISLRSEPWWMASNICWAFSLYFSIAKSLFYLRLLNNHAKHLDLSKPKMKEEFKKNSRLQLDEILTGLSCICDLVYAIHLMPAGVLWSGKLKEWHIGALGIVSSSLILLQTFMLKDKIS